MKKIFCLLTTGLLLACSHAPETVGHAPQNENKPASQTSIEAKQVAAEQEAHFVTEISFKKGSKQLSETSREKLEHLLEKAQKAAPVDEIKAIAWADEEYPANKKKNLSKGQKELAQDRSKEIERFFEGRNKDLKVETYNMAERPSAFSEFMQTEGARLKDSLETSGIQTTDKKTSASSKSSKAIVMIVLKTDKR